MATIDGAPQEFLQDCWYVAAWDHEVNDGKMLARTLLEKPILLFRGQETGAAVALDDRCCHRGAPLSMGRIEGDCVRCMYHGMKFDSSGKCIEIPGQERIPPQLGVPSYPLTERDGLIWIWMGDSSKANPDLIPSYPPMSDPQWRGLPGYLHYDANYLLIVDNLCDIGHLAFVHTETLCPSEDYAWDSKPGPLEREDWGFRVERWHHDAEAPPYHKLVIPPQDRGKKLNRRNIAEMHIPGVFFLNTWFAEPEWTPEDGDDAPNVRAYRNAQYMTPETRRTTHFFWKYLHNWDTQNENITISLRDSMIRGFHEDKDFIEAQQKMFDANPDTDLLAIAADAGMAHVRWRLDQMITGERQEQVAETSAA